MGIDLYKYDYKQLVADLMGIDGVDDQGKLENILSECGDIFGDTYLILNNECVDEGNPFYGVAGLIDLAFKVEDSFDVILKNGKSAKDHIDIDEIAEKLNITLPCV